MNWNEIDEQWQQVKGQIKARWAKLSDTDIQSFVGKDKREQLVGMIHERYGILEDRAEQQVDAWIAELTPTPAT